MSYQDDIAASMAQLRLQSAAIADGLTTYTDLCRKFDWRAADIQRQRNIEMLDAGMDSIAAVMKRLETLANG